MTTFRAMDALADAGYLGLAREIDSERLAEAVRDVGIPDRSRARVQLRYPPAELGIPRSRGALSGGLLILLGGWGALVPFVGPYFGYAYTPDTAWHFTLARVWLEILPGGAAVLRPSEGLPACARRSSG
jgi:hypothetical protein